MEFFWRFFCLAVVPCAGDAPWKVALSRSCGMYPSLYHRPYPSSSSSGSSSCREVVGGFNCQWHFYGATRARKL